MKTLPFDVELSVPADVAICPYCSGKLTEMFKVRLGRPSNFRLFCENEIEDGDDHMAGMAYLHWRAVLVWVQDWFNQNYVFGDDHADD